MGFFLGNHAIAFHGRLQSADGQPLRGADVELAVVTVYFSFPLVGEDRSEKRIVAQTDSDGRVAFRGVYGRYVSVSGCRLCGKGYDFDKQLGKTILDYGKWFGVTLPSSETNEAVLTVKRN